MDYAGFVRHGRERWSRFEARLQAARSGGALAHDELEALAIGYRQVLHDHALAAARFPGTSISERLRALAVAGTHWLSERGTRRSFSLRGFYGDGSKATNALFASPGALAVDTAGNVLIADEGNERIRKVTPKGIITTVAGRSTSGFSGDGGPADAAEIGRARTHLFGEEERIVALTEGSLAFRGARIVAHQGGGDGVC